MLNPRRALTRNADLLIGTLRGRWGHLTKTTVINGQKFCPRCKQTKPISEYNFNQNGKRKGNIRSYCRLCEKDWRLEWSHRTGKAKTYRVFNPVVDGMKLCTRCGQTKPVSEFYLRHGDREGEPYSICKACKNRRVTECAHESGRWKPMSENKECSNYLGVHIAERVLSTFFENITRMPIGNPGYDYVCGRGFRIDVKSSCLRYNTNASPYWGFNIRGNISADYFLLLAFNDRDALEPQHIWLVSRGAMNGRKNLLIPNVPKSLAKWEKFEHPLDKVIACCKSIRSTA